MAVKQSADVEISETRKVNDWRNEVLRRAGIENMLALKLAKSESDLHKIVAAHEAGCDDETLVEIFT